MKTRLFIIGIVIMAGLLPIIGLVGVLQAAEEKPPEIRPVGTYAGYYPSISLIRAVYYQTATITPTATITQPGLVFVDLPSGNVGVIEMKITAGEIATLMTVGAVLIVALYSVIRSIAASIGSK